MIDQAERIEACDDEQCRWKCRCARGIIWQNTPPGVEVPMHRGIGGPQCSDYIDASVLEVEG